MSKGKAAETKKSDVDWGTPANNRRAKFHSITKRGLKQLTRETEDRERISGVMGRVSKLGQTGIS